MVGCLGRTGASRFPSLFRVRREQDVVGARWHERARRVLSQRIAPGGGCEEAETKGKLAQIGRGADKGERSAVGLFWLGGFLCVVGGIA